MRGRLEQEDELGTDPLPLAGGDEELTKGSHKKIRIEETNLRNTYKINCTGG